MVIFSLPFIRMHRVSGNCDFRSSSDCIAAALEKISRAGPLTLLVRSKTTGMSTLLSETILARKRPWTVSFSDQLNCVYPCRCGGSNGAVLSKHPLQRKINLHSKLH